MSSFYPALITLLVATTVSTLAFDLGPHCAENEDLDECPGLNEPTCEMPIKEKGDGTCLMILKCACKKNFYRHSEKCVSASVCAGVVKDFEKRLAGATV
uniref:Kazal-like domain-containing protein n=1 Tax=Panagrellus redivivus TaxID=6233 RepID=A0A7E4ZRF7_PANRE